MYVNSRRGNRLSDNALRWDSFRQASFIHDAQFPIDLPPVADWHGPFLCRFKGRQVEGLEQCVIAGEDTALPVQFPVCGIQALYRVRGIYDLPHSSGELEDWADGIPVLFPAPHGIRILPAPFLCHTFQGIQGLFFRWLLIDRLPVSAERLTVLV